MVNEFHNETQGHDKIFSVYYVGWLKKLISIKIFKKLHSTVTCL